MRGNVARADATGRMNKTSNLSGIAAMLAATAVFVLGDSFMKLVTETVPPFEVLFLRGLAASAACAVLLAVRGEWRAIVGAVHGRVLPAGGRGDAQRRSLCNNNAIVADATDAEGRSNVSCSRRRTHAPDPNRTDHFPDCWPGSGH